MAQIFYFCGHEQFQPEQLVKHAMLAEKAGFDGVFVSEHFNPWVADKGAAGFAFSTLGAIAVKTEKIQLMTGVVTPLYRYHPAVVAQAAATIDRLSNGRFWLGVGTGEAINEAPLGYHFPKYDERSARVKEAITMMQQLVTRQKVTFDGTYYTTKNVKLYSPPLHTIPVLLAAGGEKSSIVAAEYGDGIIVSVKDVQEANEKILNPYREHLQGKTPCIVASRWSVFAHNTEEAWSALQAWRGLRAPSRNTATDPEGLQKEADELPREEIVSRYTMVGSAQAYIRAYAPLINDLDADIVAIQTTAANKQEDLIAMLGKEVVPELKKL